MRGLLVGLLLLLLGVAPGCYYGQLASGQLKLMLARESSAKLRSDPDTPSRLRAQLDLVERARAFAEQLGLEVGGRYTSYVDWPGDRLVTTIVAANPGQVEAAPFRFPLVGEVPYKGFFDQHAAEAEAESLRAQGKDVCVIGVSAYSTLGWMDDPVTAPMLQRGDDRLVETILHELVHATVFVPSQPEFNEGVARFIGQEAAVRFFGTQAERERVQDDRRVAAALLGFRAQVAALYASRAAEAPTGAGEPDERLRLESDFREQLVQLPLTTRDPALIAGYVRLNDACLAIGSTYASDDARYEALLAEMGGDLPRFIARLREAATADDPRAAFLGSEGGSEPGTTSGVVAAAATVPAPESSATAATPGSEGAAEPGLAADAVPGAALEGTLQ